MWLTRQQKYEGHVKTRTCDVGQQYTKNQVSEQTCGSDVTWTRLRTALSAAKARLAAQQRIKVFRRISCNTHSIIIGTSMLRLVGIRTVVNRRPRQRIREEELVEGEQLVVKICKFSSKGRSLIQAKFQVCKALSRCKAVVNAASIEFYDDDDEKDSKDEEQKEKSDDQELYESLRALLERARATVIRLTDERDRLEGVSMKAAQSALRDARSTVEQLRKEEEAREIEEELLQAELTALVVRYLYFLSIFA